MEKFSASEKGLDSAEAKQRLKKYGRNVVKKTVSFSWVRLLWGQFNNALMWILIIAGLLALPFGEFRDATIIFIIVFLNAGIGFFQEYRAEKTLEHIKNLTADKAVVLRDGEKREINSSLLVPGDIVYLTAGDTVPADGYIIEGFDVSINEFIFTGESKPGKKIVGALEEQNLPLSERDNMVFSGTAVVRGDVTVLVTETNMETQLGHIANMVTEIKEEETPLQKQIRILGKDVSIIAIIIAVLVLIAGRYSQLSWYDGFLFALVLAVSVVPNGLPAAISVSLSLGMKKLLKDNVLAKKLVAVETLASVTIICTDKTGTITRNELMVTDIVAGDEEYTVGGQGYEPQGEFLQFGRVAEIANKTALQEIFHIAYLCNDAALVKNEKGYVITGDPTEGALIVAAEKFNPDFKKSVAQETKINEVPFSSDRMRMSVVYKDAETGSCNALVKGSPDVLLNLCTHKMLADGSVVEFSEAEKQKARNWYNAMSEKALRVLAFARSSLNEEVCVSWSQDSEKNLVWVGMMGMIDPPRADVGNAIRECLKSGIKVVMITGDYEITARAIAKQVGLLNSADAQVVNGKTLDTLSDENLIKLIREKEVAFARITPEQKLRIATLLKKSGEVIAMTGDGVNDAPALKKADIGMAMGVIGTDVAKEAADVILLDDNFASIVKVIREGRTIYQNLRKIIVFTFTANAGEFFTAILGILLQIPAPITAIQILAIDLGTDVFPSFSLSLEPAEPNIMGKKPFKSNERVINGKGVWRLVRVGLIMGTGAVIAFILSMKRGGWDFGNKIDSGSVLYMRSTTAAYAALSLAQLASLMQVRSETLSVFTLGFFKNKFAIGAIVIAIAMLLAFMYVPMLSENLRMLPITWKDWAAAIATMLAVFIFEEALKVDNKD